MTQEYTPTTITAGNSASWLLSFDDYPASDGWSIDFVLLNSTTKIEFSSTAEDDAHLFEVAATTTALWTPGDYKYTALVTDGTDRYTVETGHLIVFPDPAETATLDGRTHAEICLENIEAVLENKATADNYSYSIAGRSLSKYTWDELIRMRDYYRAEVQIERVKAAGKKSNKVLVRFV